MESGDEDRSGQVLYLAKVRRRQHFGSGRAHMSTLMVALASFRAERWTRLPRSRGFGPPTRSGEMEQLGLRVTWFLLLTCLDDGGNHSMENTWQGGLKCGTLFEASHIPTVSLLPAMSKRLKLSDLAKVVAKKAATSASKGVVISEGAATAEKILAGVVLPADKEKVDRLTFDQVVTKFLHVVGQGVILGSSLAVRSRDFAEGALNQKAVAESAEMEMVRAQNRAIELEGALAEEKAKGTKLAEDVDARGKVISKLEARVSDLERASPSHKAGSSPLFKRRQLAKQYPDLGVDLEDVEMDQELLAKEEAEAEKRAAEEEAAEVEEVGEAA
ncbi:hypothetical protein Acr_00g0037710 [Actinidia rufa]|uniref:Uncharacterized protein n=1 Tax=Actinidia rufa TaxID=165716 RepID=A0A7J0DGX8_9ERIC|nr:hypothetical protein Acr_00g0037710 [Actinidia rufa]